MSKKQEVRDRQVPLTKLFRAEPELAMVTDSAHTTGRWPNDPFHGEVIPEKHLGDPIKFGIHENVGGLHDGPTAGDILCAALACCLDSSIRLVAGRTGVELEELSVRVEADVDVRGSLMIDTNVPVGFQNMRCTCSLKAVEGTDPELLDRVTMAAEYCCIVMRTLRDGVDIETSFDVGLSDSPVQVSGTR